MTSAQRGTPSKLIREGRLCSENGLRHLLTRCPFWVGKPSSQYAARRWVKLESAEDPCSLWLDALEAGVRALTGYAPNKHVGPRETGEDEDADPVG